MATPEPVFFFLKKTLDLLLLRLYHICKYIMHQKRGKQESGENEMDNAYTPDSVETACRSNADPVILLPESDAIICPPCIPPALVQDGFEETIESADQNADAVPSAFDEEVLAVLESRLADALKRQSDEQRRVHLAYGETKQADALLDELGKQVSSARRSERVAEEAVEHAESELRSLEKSVRDGLPSLLSYLHDEDALSVLSQPDLAADTHIGLDSDATSLISFKAALSQMERVNRKRGEYGRAPLRISLRLCAHASTAANARANGTPIMRGADNAAVIILPIGSVVSAVCRGAAALETSVARGSVSVAGREHLIEYESEIDPDRLSSRYPFLLSHPTIAPYLLLCSSRYETAGIGICMTSGAAMDGCIVVELCGRGTQTQENALTIDDLSLVIGGFESRTDAKREALEEKECLLAEAKEKVEEAERSFAEARRKAAEARSDYEQRKAALARIGNEVADAATALSDYRLRAGF